LKGLLNIAQYVCILLLIAMLSAEAPPFQKFYDLFINILNGLIALFWIHWVWMVSFNNIVA